MAGEKFDSKSFNPQAFGAYTERIPNLKKNELIKSRALKVIRISKTRSVHRQEQYMQYCQCMV